MMNDIDDETIVDEDYCLHQLSDDFLDEFNAEDLGTLDSKMSAMPIVPQPQQQEHSLDEHTMINVPLMEGNDMAEWPQNGLGSAAPGLVIPQQVAGTHLESATSFDCNNVAPQGSAMEIVTQPAPEYNLNENTKGNGATVEDTNMAASGGTSCLLIPYHGSSTSALGNAEPPQKKKRGRKPKNPPPAKKEKKRKMHEDPDDPLNKAAKNARKIREKNKMILEFWKGRCATLLRDDEEFKNTELELNTLLLEFNSQN